MGAYRLTRIVVHIVTFRPCPLFLVEWDARVPKTISIFFGITTIVNVPHCVCDQVLPCGWQDAVISQHKTLPKTLYQQDARKSLRHYFKCRIVLYYRMTYKQFPHHILRRFCRSPSSPAPHLQRIHFWILS